MAEYNAQGYTDGLYVAVCKGLEKNEDTILGIMGLLYCITTGERTIASVEEEERMAKGLYYYKADDVARTHKTDLAMVELIECYTTKEEREQGEELVGSVGFVVVQGGSVIYTKKEEVLEFCGYEGGTFTLGQLEEWDERFTQNIAGKETEE